MAHCFFFDKLTGEGDSIIARYKAAGLACSLDITPGSEETAELLGQLQEF